MVLPRFKPAPVEVKPSTVERQANRLVKRSPTGSIEKATTPVVLNKPVNWRKATRELTNNGLDLIKRLYDISQGAPYRAVLEDGKYTEWEVPTIETQRAAAKDLFEFLHGKAVAQTEVLKAAKESEEVEKYQALSDDALKEFLKRVESGEEVDAEFAELTEGEEP